MSKATIPLIAVEIGGDLQAWYYNNCVLRSDVTKTIEGTNVVAENGFEFTIGEVNNILAETGEVEEYLMAVRSPISIMSTDVPDTLPKYLGLDDTGTLVAKTFSAWFNTGVELWKKDDDSEIIFYTNPFAGNASSYLKGSEIKIINDLGAPVSILTIADATTLIDAGGWNKLTT